MAERVLIVGDGGREHAFEIQARKSGAKLYCTPGTNAGMLRDGATPVGLDPSDIGGIADYAQREKIDITIVGPEAPLVAGMGDEFRRRGLKIVGPNMHGANLEGDKSFAKDFMTRHGMPTAQYQTFTDMSRAEDYLRGRKISPHNPVVIKAAGLAAGKGVVICYTQDEAMDNVHGMMSGDMFKDAGKTVVIEDFLRGREMSKICLVDGTTIRPLANSRDHKPAFVNAEDREIWLALGGDPKYRDYAIGPNTGGMGAYAPVLDITPDIEDRITQRILRPLMKGLLEDEIDYRGFLYIGLMIDGEGNPYVLEFNCRSGDPETQVILPLMDSDLLNHLHACADGKLAGENIRVKDTNALCVVAAAPKYPGTPPKGLVVDGMPEERENLIVYHGGTRLDGGRVVTNGGRVFGITGTGPLKEAHNNVYRAIRRMTAGGKPFYFSTTIGQLGLE
jgi:phosphoribosylamine--glycine ligase